MKLLAFKLIALWCVGGMFGASKWNVWLQNEGLPTVAGGVLVFLMIWWDFRTKLKETYSEGLSDGLNSKSKL